MAQWLPVGLVPEQILIALVRFDVVDHLRCRGDTGLGAVNAQWVQLQEPCSRYPPLMAIASGC